MTVWIRIAMWIAAGFAANSIEFVTFDQVTGMLKVDMHALTYLIGTPGAVSGALGGVALAWWRYAKRKGKPT